jgi:hypothetical protein
MGEFDTESWLEGALLYQRLRRQYWGGYLGFIATCLVVVVVFHLGAALKLKSVDGILLGAVGIAIPVAFAAIFAAWNAWINLALIRCPRCGMRGIVSRSSDHCTHCDLDFGKAAIPKAKPLDVDRLE